MTKQKDNWWQRIEEEIADVHLGGLEVVCPNCGETGLVATRWLKGPSLKPIGILHMRCKKVLRVCNIDEETAREIRNKVNIREADIRNLLKSKRAFILFSGGKDSLATLIYLRGIAKRVKREITALYVDTTAGLPANTRYVRKVCKYLGVLLEIVKPKVDYFTLAKKWGIPSFGYRWCCRELKIKPLEEYLSKVKEPKVVFDGIRAAESNVRRRYIPIWYHPSFKCLSVSPIFYWSDEEVVSCINSNGIPRTFLHSLGTSTECWCGAYKTQSDFEKLYELDRTMFNKLAILEKRSKSGYTFLYKDGHRIPLISIAKRLKNKS